MPIVTVTNLTSRKLPISTYIGVLEALASKSVTLSVTYLEKASATLEDMEEAGLISYTVAQETNADKYSFAPVSVKGGMWNVGSGCPNGEITAPQGAVYTNTAGGTTAAAGVGSITTVAYASLLPGVDYFNVNDGLTGIGGTYTFQFTDATHPVSSSNYIAVLLAGTEDADAVRDRIITVVNASGVRVTAASGGAANVALTQQDLGVITGAAITEHVADAGFTVVDFAAAADCVLWVHVMPTTIASSTDATPIRVTTAANHGLANGDVVTISSHVTNTNANGTWTITRVSRTAFDLIGSTATGGGAGGATGTLVYTSSAFNWIGK
jgi:hypothetical protein